jgi:16S rRNA (adenine1518-N6/adenine1519-N6)-dimethyltransferase
MQNLSAHPRKRFGQHFLHDPAVIQHIIAVLALQPADHVVEIGPGLGALTKYLLPLTHKLEVVELDRDIIPELKANCAGLGELIIHQADALRFDFTQLVQKKIPLRLIGNLPYNISTPLIFHLLTQARVIKDMHFMLQKEVVERMAARPGNKIYGRLSIMVQYYCKVESLFTIKPGAFSPPPKVDSAVVRLQPYATIPFVAQDPELFAEVVRQAFNQRRKVLRNCLRSLVAAQAWQDLAIDPGSRPEQLSVADYVRIANYLFTQK